MPLTAKEVNDLAYTLENESIYLATGADQPALSLQVSAPVALLAHSVFSIADGQAVFPRLQLFTNIIEGTEIQAFPLVSPFLIRCASTPAVGDMLGTAPDSYEMQVKSRANFVCVGEHDSGLAWCAQSTQRANFVGRVLSGTPAIEGPGVEQGLAQIYKRSGTKLIATAIQLPFFSTRAIESLPGDIIRLAPVANFGLRLE